MLPLRKSRLLVFSHPPEFHYRARERSCLPFRSSWSLLPFSWLARPSLWVVVRELIRVSKRLLRAHPLQQFLRRLSRRPRGPLHRDFRVLAKTISSLRSVHSFPYYPDLRYARRSSMTSRQGSLPLSTCLPSPSDSGRVHSFRELARHVPSVQTSWILLLQCRGQSKSTFPLGGRHHPMSICPSSLSSSHRSRSLTSRVRQLLSILRLRLLGDYLGRDICRTWAGRLAIYFFLPLLPRCSLRVRRTLW